MIELVIIGVGVAIVGASVWLNPARRIKRALRAAPTVPIGKLSEGDLGRIVGKARVLDDQLVAPLTGRACVYYIARVQQEDSDDDWKTIIEEEQGVTFVVDDGSGRAIVDPRGGDLALDFDARSRSGTFHDPDEREAAFLAKYGVKSHGLIFNKRLRYREAVIEIGETVAVLGAGVREPDPTAAPGGYRDAQPTRLRLAPGRYPLLVSDDPSTTRR
jgi:hypothetical protein